jgi:ATP-grasp domain, R2K clade family 3
MLSRVSEASQPPVIVVSESGSESGNESGSESGAVPIARQTAMAIAQILGFQIYRLPQDLHKTVPEISGSTQFQTTWGIWLATLPDLTVYTAVYQSALSKNIRLLNTPEQHSLAQDFDRTYALLQGLVPKVPATSWATVRQQTALRCCHSVDGSSLGRLFRVFVCDRTILTYGYVWATDDPLKWLTVADEESIFGVVLPAAERLGVPFVAIEVGQQANGDWAILDVGDAQFASFAQMPMMHFWYELEKIST